MYCGWGRTQGNLPEEDVSHSKAGKPGLWTSGRVVKTERALGGQGLCQEESQGAMEDSKPKSACTRESHSDGGSGSPFRLPLSSPFSLLSGPLFTLCLAPS